MKIFVCIKQVPSTETKIQLHDDSSRINNAGVKWEINPYDEFAIEEALKLKESIGGDSRVTLISLGPKKRVLEAIRMGLAMGSDEGILIDAPEDLDCHSTAKALAMAIDSEGGAAVIFTGKLSIDDNASSVSQMLAEHLNLPHTTVVSKFSESDGIFTLEREIEGGTREVVQLTGPSVIGANKGLNMPRYASLPGIMKAKKKPVKEINLIDFNLSDSDKKISFTNFQLPPEKPPVKMIEGDVAQQCVDLTRLLREEAKVL